MRRIQVTFHLHSLRQVSLRKSSFIYRITATNVMEQTSALLTAPDWCTKIELCFISHSAIDQNVPDRAGV